MKRYDSIQLLRAIAAISVVVYHAAATHSAHAARGWTKPLSFEAPVGAAGVDLFFVITGFIMVGISRFFSNAPITPQEFFYRRITRLVPVYWFYTSAMLFLFIAASQLMYASQKLVPLNVIGSYLFFPYPREDGSTIPLLYVGWTLNIEIMLCVVFGASLFMQKQARTAFVILIVAVFAGWGMILPPQSNQFWIANQLYIEFLYGMFIGWLTINGYRLREPTAWVLMIGGLLLFLVFPPREEIRSVTWGLCAFLVVMGAVSIERRMPALLVLLGDASYSIYLSHIFTAPAVSRVVYRFVDNPYICVIAVIAASTAAGVLAYFAVEKPLLVASPIAIRSCRAFGSLVQDCVLKSFCSRIVGLRGLGHAPKA
jgi:peptidoglycan/LPS O-acetylase OafA/YrhL